LETLDSLVGCRAGRRIPNRLKTSWIPLLAAASGAVFAGTPGHAPLSPAAAWNDPQSKIVFTDDFTQSEPCRLHLLAADGTPIEVARIAPDSTPEGGSAAILEIELQPGKRLHAGYDMPEQDIQGLTYRFDLAITTDPPLPADQQPLRLELNRGRFADSIYLSQPLEHPEIRDGQWLTQATESVFRLQGEYLYRGWTRYEGNTAASFRSRYDGKPIGDLLSRLVDIKVENISEQPLRVKISLARITVIRRKRDSRADLQALLTAEAPLLAFTREQALRARQRAATGAAFPEAIVKSLDQARRLRAAPVVVPQSQAPWPHRLDCKTDRCTGRLMPEFPAGYRCVECNRLHADAEHREMLVYHQHLANARAVRCLGLAWQLQDDRQSAAKAAEILMAYARSIKDFKLGHNWLGDCWLLRDFLFGYDFIRRSLSAQERELIEEEFIRVMLNRIYHYNHHYPEGHIVLWETCTFCALLLRDSDWLDYLVFSPTGNREIIFRYGLTDDFLSLKGAAYHGDIVRGMGSVGQAIENAGVPFFDDRVQKVYAAVVRQVFPDSSLPAFGHSNVGLGAGDYEMEVAYRYYRLPAYWALTSPKRRADPGTRIFWNDPAVPQVEQLRLPSTTFAALGLTMLRNPTNESVLALSWGAPQRNDPARLDFQFFGAGGQQLWSAGTTGYTNPLFKSWYQTSVSRNGIVVDGGTQARRTGQLLALQTKDRHQAVAAELTNAYPDTTWQRAAILFEDGAALLVDRIRSPRPRTVDWVCQLPGRVEVNLRLSPEQSRLGDGNGYQCLKNVRSGPADQSFSIFVDHRADPGPRRGVVVTPAPVNGRFFLADGRTGGEARESPTCLIRQRNVAHATYAIFLEPYSRAAPRGTAVRLEHDDAELTRIFVRYNTSRRQVRIRSTNPAGQHQPRLAIDVSDGN
jgi:hypothetical protein